MYDERKEESTVPWLVNSTYYSTYLMEPVDMRT